MHKKSRHTRPMYLTQKCGGFASWNFKKSHVATVWKRICVSFCSVYRFLSHLFVNLFANKLKNDSRLRSSALLLVVFAKQSICRMTLLTFPFTQGACNSVTHAKYHTCVPRIWSFWVCKLRSKSIHECGVGQSPCPTKSIVFPKPWNPQLAWKYVIHNTIHDTQIQPSTFVIEFLFNIFQTINQII